MKKMKRDSGKNPDIWACLRQLHSNEYPRLSFAPAYSNRRAFWGTHSPRQALKRQRATPALSSKNTAKPNGYGLLSLWLITNPDRPRKIRQYRLHRRTPLITVTPRHDRICHTPRLCPSDAGVRAARKRRHCNPFSRPLQVRCRGPF